MPWRYRCGCGGRRRSAASSAASSGHAAARARTWPGSSRARRPGWRGRASESLTAPRSSARGVAGRPVRPQAVDELEVVHATTMSASGCWKKNMYQDRRSCVGEERLGRPPAGGGTAMVTTSAPAVGRVGGGAVGGHRAPVVADEHGVAVAVRAPRAARWRRRRGPRSGSGRRRGTAVGCVAAQPRRHGAEAGVGERGQEVAPRPRRVGEAVQAERERARRRTSR